MPAPAHSPPTRAVDQLPSGRHGLPPTYVAEHQRRRMLDAIVDIVARHGYPELTIAQVVVASGVSRRTFYDQFSNKEDAFLSAYDQIVHRLLAAVDAAFHAGASWCDRLERGVAVFLEVLGAEPSAAHVCMVDILSAGPTALARRTEAMSRFRPFLTPDPPAHQPARPFPPLAADAAIGGAYELVYSQILAGNALRLPELFPDVLHSLLVPFVGPEVADARYRAALIARQTTPGVAESA